MKDVDCVVAAAGRSSRMGQWKLGLRIGNKTLIEWTLIPMLEVCGRVIVVGGYKIEVLGEILKNYEKVLIVYNPRFDEGMFVSVKTGFKAVSGQRIFFTPADCPLIKLSTYQELLRHEAEAIIPAYRGRGGHPVLISSQIVPELLSEPDHSNLKAFLRKHKTLKIPVSDEGILIDIDTWERFKHLKAILTDPDKI